MHNALVTDISENGMYFITEPYLPPGFSTRLIIPFKEDNSLELPAKIVRTIKTGGIYDGFGAELSDIPRDYLEFVSSIRINGNSNSADH